MKSQTSIASPNPKLPKPLKIALICLAGAAALLGLVLAIDYFAYGGTLFQPPKEEPSTIIMDKKPIIYLYPETAAEVSVTLGSPSKLTTTYPEYKTGWHVLAEPDGTLTDLTTGRKLYALYWEGKDTSYQQTSEGFVVKGSSVAAFLEEKLALLGLNYKEAEEFIVYWLPQLEHNNYNYIRFATNKEIENSMPLSVSPIPNTTIRIMMLWRALSEPISVTEQVLSATPARTGFTVVEWGGAEL